jgi:serine/threonine-protein kinase SRPK3
LFLFLKREERYREMTTNSEKYEVGQLIGTDGRFSKVYSCRNKETDQKFALKVHNEKEPNDVIQEEIKLCCKVKRKDPQGKENVVQYFEYFRRPGQKKKQTCMVFELLGCSLLSLLNSLNDGLPLIIVREITKQILQGLKFLHETCEIIHTDIKPENLLFKESLEEMKSKVKDKDTNFTLKIIDLGNACWVDKHFDEKIQSTEYMSPEAILEADYDEKVDIWSVGCLSFEMITKDFLFKPKQTREHSKTTDHLYKIIELTGQNIPLKLQKSKKGKRYFRDGELSYEDSIKIWPLENVLIEKYEFKKEEAGPISEFILLMVNNDPEDRSSASELLVHPYLA